MKKLDPVTGPIPRDRFKEIVDAPHGEAAKAIQQYDPQWGRAPGEKFEWKVRVERDGADTGTAYVKAADQDEADALADALTESEIDWDYAEGGIMVVSVEPNGSK